MLSKKEYERAYLNAYNDNQNIKVITKRIKKLSNKKLDFNFLFVLIPIIFTFGLDFVLMQNKNNSFFIENNYYNFEEFNKTYVENPIKPSKDLIGNYSMNIDSKLDKIITDHMSVELYQRNIQSDILNSFQARKASFKSKKNLNFDFSSNISDKKKYFIKIVLPLIVDNNKKILALRLRLQEVKNYLDINKTLSKKDQKFIKNLSQNYNVKFKNRHKIDIIKDLLLKVDIIPNSIVLAQAAIESGWGSSRFAQKYNALFGEYTYDNKSGIVPLERSSSDKFLVKFFSSINKSVESYFNNINTHFAYEKFRKERYKQRENNNNFNIYFLLKELNTYAEDINYVDTLNSIIKINKLKKYDNIPSI